ncbi:MAG: hypothetical protein R3B13_20695 [Polyangiaceae bacterium]
METRLPLAPTLLAALLLTTSVATAGSPTAKQCIEAYESAQLTRQDSKLVEARAALLVCASEACPSVMRKDCVLWLDEVAKDVPSIVVTARGPDGDIAEVRVAVDGKVVAERLDGKPLELDPGSHAIVLEAEGFNAVKQQIVLAVGQRNRRLNIEFAPAQTQPSSPPSTDPKGDRQVPTASWILGGAGALAIGVGGYFGIRALNRRSDLDACKPGCDSAAVGDVERDYVISEVGIGLGLVAVGSAIYFALTDAPQQTSTPALRVVAQPAGASVGLAGRFQ